MTDGRKWTAAIALVVALLVVLFGTPPKQHVTGQPTQNQPPYERMP